jgi:hypothetical protein
LAFTFWGLGCRSGRRQTERDIPFAPGDRQSQRFPSGCYAWRRSHLASSLPLRAKRGKERDKDSVGVDGEHMMAAPAGPRIRLLGSWLGRDPTAAAPRPRREQLLGLAAAPLSPPAEGRGKAREEKVEAGKRRGRGGPRRRPTSEPQLALPLLHAEETAIRKREAGDLRHRRGRRGVQRRRGRHRGGRESSGVPPMCQRPPGTSAGELWDLRPP